MRHTPHATSRAPRLPVAAERTTTSVGSLAECSIAAGQTVSRTLAALTLSPSAACGRAAAHVRMQRPPVSRENTGIPRHNRRDRTIITRLRVRTANWPRLHVLSHCSRASVGRHRHPRGPEADAEPENARVVTPRGDEPHVMRSLCARPESRRSR